MNEIKRAIKNHIEGNILKYAGSFALFLAGVVLGVASGLSGAADVTENIVQSIRTTCEGIGAGGVDNEKIFWISLYKNFRNCFIIFLGGLSVWLTPLIAVVLFFYGFSYGFTVGFLSLNLGSDGFMMGVSSVIINLLIAVPVYIALGVIAFNNSAGRRKRVAAGGTAGYAAGFIMLFVLILPAIAADAFAVPELVKQICVRIIS